MINQQAIEFNNKGVAFLECGHLNDALDMFLGAMQVMLHSVQGPATAAAASNNKHINTAMRKAQYDPQDSSKSFTLTEDKVTNQYVSSKAIRLPKDIADLIISPLSSSQNQDDDNKEKNHMNQRLTLCSAIILYNTALIYQMRSSKLASMKTAIRLYEKACHLIADLEDTIVNTTLAFHLVIVTINNMIHLYIDLQCIDMANTYVDYLTEFIVSKRHQEQQEQEQQQCLGYVSTRTSNNDDDAKRKNLLNEELNQAEEYILNARLTLFLPLRHAAAA